MRSSLVRKPAMASSLTFLLVSALVGCDGGKTSVETEGLSVVGSSSTTMPLDGPTPAPGSEKARALEPEGPVDDQTLAKGRDKYKKLKKAENANPLDSIVPEDEAGSSDITSIIGVLRMSVEHRRDL